MANNGLDDIDKVFLQYACNSSLSDKLNEITNARPRKIAREMTEGDIYVLAKYISFPRNDGGTINIKAARQEIERFLLNYPFFQRENHHHTVL